MPNMALAVALIGFVLMALNVVFFVLLSYKKLMVCYSRYKRNENVDEMLNNAINSYEVHKMFSSNDGWE